MTFKYQVLFDFINLKRYAMLSCINNLRVTKLLTFLSDFLYYPKKSIMMQALRYVLLFVGTGVAFLFTYLPSVRGR